MKNFLKSLLKIFIGLLYIGLSLLIIYFICEYFLSFMLGLAIMFILFLSYELGNKILKK